MRSRFQPDHRAFCAVLALLFAVSGAGLSGCFTVDGRPFGSRPPGPDGSPGGFGRPDSALVDTSRTPPPARLP